MTAGPHGPSTPTVVRGDGVLTIDERVEVVWGHRRHPHVHLRTPAGHRLTIDGPADHPWHHALWFAIKFVNGENFWEEYDAYGVQRSVAEPEVIEPEWVTIESDLAWIRPDRETMVLAEQRRLLYQPLDDRSYRLSFVVTLHPEVEVLLDRTPFTTWGGYGGLTLRGRPDWRDTVIRLDDGADRVTVHGDRSRWLAIDGVVGDDADPVGVVISTPDPMPWYASTKADTYGAEGWSNFVNAAFLWDGPITVMVAEPLTLVHEVLVHDGAWSTDEVQEVVGTWW